MNNKAPVIDIDGSEWTQAIRLISTSTNERTYITATLASGGLGNSASEVNYANARAVASALVLANMNSLPFDWAARFSVGGSNLNFFIIKQLPVLPPREYLARPMLSGSDIAWVELIIPRVLELTYTAHDLRGFAVDLGFDGPPFTWNATRRHRLQSELDAMFAHMYGLNRSELEWILDAPPPSSSFPTLKRTEISEFGEYRTRRYVLAAFDALQRSEIPDLNAIGA